MSNISDDINKHIRSKRSKTGDGHNNNYDFHPEVRRQQVLQMEKEQSVSGEMQDWILYLNSHHLEYEPFKVWLWFDTSERTIKNDKVPIPHKIRSEIIKRCDPIAASYIFGLQDVLEKANRIYRSGRLRLAIEQTEGGF